MSSKYDASILSDLHKAARGFRPGEGFWSNWNASSEDEKTAIWDNLIVELEHENNDEERRQADAIAAWNADIARVIAIGAGTRKRAIVWDAQAYGINLRDPQKAGFYCFERGLPYSYERQVMRAFQGAR